MMLEAPNVDMSDWSANLDNVIGDCVHLKRLVWHQPRENPPVALHVARRSSASNLRPEFWSVSDGSMIFSL